MYIVNRGCNVTKRENLYADQNHGLARRSSASDED
jgi:hypothetical protein